MGKTDIFNYRPSDEQLKQLDSLLAILAECDQLGIRAWVVGGYGLDALYGALTRDHGDFDLFIKEESKDKFIQIIRRHGYQYTPQKVGAVGKTVFRNPSLSPDFRLELGTIEQAKKLLQKLNIIKDSTLFVPKRPLGSLQGQPIWTPTREGFKKIIEINDQLLKKDNPHRDWHKKILMGLEKKRHKLHF